MGLVALLGLISLVSFCAGVLIEREFGGIHEYKCEYGTIIELPHPCLHGHLDWDDCPDCCH
jgi:hypothetical protein